MKSFFRWLAERFSPVGAFGCWLVCMGVFVDAPAPGKWLFVAVWLLTAALGYRAGVRHTPGGSRPRDRRVSALVISQLISPRNHLCLYVLLVVTYLLALDANNVGKMVVVSLLAVTVALAYIEGMGANTRRASQ